MYTKFFVFSGKLGDYVDCPEDKENDTCMTIPRTLSSPKNVIETPPGLKENLSARDLPQTPNSTKVIFPKIGDNKELTPPPPLKNTMLMSRIQRDLNSPSASVRMRALKAISSPAQSSYCHFDVPEAEQSLHLSHSQDNIDLKDIMRNVVVYVEVRSGEDDRSEGVRKVIEALGARVNRTLNKDTTHVIFKEGRLSTFKKAQQCGIPVVSILWIEACKTQKRICDPKDFPISNLDRYENPELYSKMKVFRHMQPGSECSRRKVKTPTLPKNATKSLHSKRNYTANETSTTPTSSSDHKQNKKTDISQFFKKIEKSNKIETDPTITATPPPGDIHKIVASDESPASQLLKRITSNSYTPTLKKKSKIDGDCKEKSGNNSIFRCHVGEIETESSNYEINSKNVKVKKVLNFLQTQNQLETIGAATNVKENPTNSVFVTAPVSKEIPKKLPPFVPTASKELPKSSSRRRSLSTSQHNHDKETNDQGGDSLKTTPQKRRRCSNAVTEDSENIIISKTPTRNPRRRSTVHTPKNMTIDSTLLHESRPIDDIAEEDSEQYKNNNEDKEKNLMLKQNNNTDKNDAHIGISKSGRKRTVYSYKTMNESGIQAAIGAPKGSKRRHTNYSVKSMETQTLSSFIQDVTSIEENAKRDKETNVTISQNSLPVKEVKTLYTPTKVAASNSSNVFFADIMYSGRESGGGIYLTPSSSGSKGNVAACSTLLEDADNPPKLVETSPTAATNGKLVEETDKCATPLVFSSSKQPGNKRRTFFDVSMDIITQRLQCINKSARRSLNPSAMENIINNSKPSPGGTTTTDTIDDTQKKQPTLPDKGSENSTPSTKQCTTPTPDGVGSSHVKKKRKLFVPNEPLTPPSISIVNNNTVANRRASLNASARKTSLDESVTKRRRTLLPASQPANISKTLSKLSTTTEPKESPVTGLSSALSDIRKRRSTLDFEEVKSTENKIELITKNKTEETTNASGEVEAASAQENENYLKKKVEYVLVYTNMHKEQVDVIREAVEKFSNATLEEKVSDNTTHLVSLEPRRTMNLLRALVRGLWILDYSWVTESMRAGFLLPEEPFELQGFSRAIEISRSERQAFGNRYKNELFHDIGLVYISLRCYPVRREDLIELITLCGGRIAQNRNKARYIIGDPNTVLENKIYVTPYWVLDSISQMQIMKIQKYQYPKPFERPDPLSPKV